METLARFPRAIGRKYHVVALNLGMQNGLAKGHAGSTDKTLHLLFMQSSFDEFIEQTLVGRCQEVTFHD